MVILNKLVVVVVVVVDLGGWRFAVPFYSVQDCRSGPSSSNAF